MERNKVHKATYVRVAHSRALCGVDSGNNRRNVVPTSREDRDVTCKRCMKIIAKRKARNGKL